MPGPIHYIKPTFAGGEYAPSMYSRVDVARYSSGAKTLLNFIVHPYGGASNRPGWHFVAKAKFASRKFRLHDFQFSSTQTYTIEFGHLYARFFTNGSQIIVPSADAWLTSTSYVIGNYVTHSGIIYYCTANHTSGTFATDLSNGDWVAQNVFEIPTPYQEADLPGLDFTQSADVLFIFTQKYQTRQLNRFGTTNWTLTLYQFMFGPCQIPNSDITFTITPSDVTGSITLDSSAALFNAGHVGGLFQINHNVAEQSLAVAVTDTTPTSSILSGGTWRIITHGTWSGTFAVQKSTDNGSTWTNIRTFSSADDFNANTFGTEDMSNNAPAFLVRVAMSSHVSGTMNVTLTADAFRNIGYVMITAYSSSTEVTGTVTKLLGGTTATFDWAEGSWSDYRGWPAVGEFNQDRLVTGNTPTEPQTIWQTKASNYYDYSRSNPLVDSDAISTNLPSRQLNGVNGFIPLNSLVALTSASEWGIGAADVVMSPLTITQKPFGYDGSSGLKPLIIKNRAVYVQFMGAVVLDLGYELVSNSFTGANLSILSNHLFDGFSIIDMCYQQYPDSIVWCVRNDGVLLSMTYLREQEVIAWAHHETQGIVETVCSIPSNGYNQVWLGVRRGDERFIEFMDHRMASTLPEDQFFVDCGISYNGNTPDGFVKLWMQFDDINNSTNFIDSNNSPKTILIPQAGPVISTDQSKFGGSSGLFKGGSGIDSYTKLLLHMNGSNGSTTFTDSELTPKTVTAHGAAAISTTASKFGGASGLFGGAATSDYLSLPDSADFNFGSGDFTIDFWVKFIDLTVDVVFCSQLEAGAGPNFAIYRSTVDGIIHCVTEDVTGVTVLEMASSPNAIADTNWHHVAVVRNGANNYIFIDGIAQTLLISSTGTQPDISAPFEIGRLGGGRDSSYFNGYFNEFRISKGIARWVANFTPPLAAYTIPGYLEIDSTPADFDFGSGDSTVDFWIYLTQGSSKNGIMTKNQANSALSIFIDANNKVNWSSIQTAGGTNWNIISSSSVPIAQWTHLAFVRSGSTQKIYINGVADANSATSSATVDSQNVALFLGRLFTDDAYLTAYIDELKSAKGVARWTANFTPPSVSGFQFTSNVISGLDHLEGNVVAILADGVPQVQQTVTGGEIVLAVPATKVHIGLPYTSDLETLNIEVPLPDGTMQGRKVRVSRATIRLYNSKGGYMGPDSNSLTKLDNRFQNYQTSTALYTGDLKHTMGGGYSDGGRMFIRQIDPLPITVLAIMPILTVGGTTLNDAP